MAACVSPVALTGLKPDYKPRGSTYALTYILGYIYPASTNGQGAPHKGFRRNLRLVEPMRGTIVGPLRKSMPGDPALTPGPKPSLMRS